VARQRVAVIGGGLAGLAAAVDLKEAGWEVVLFERSRLLGGRATSFTVGGVEVDNGQHVFLGCFTEFQDFVHRLGLGHTLRLQDRFEALVLSRRGPGSRLRAAPLPPPWHLLVSFVSYRHLGWRAKAQVARALFRARRGASPGETFDAWLERLGQGAEARRAFWEPFFVPALNAPLDRVGAGEALFVLRTAFLAGGEAARIGYCTVPLARLAAAAAARLDRVVLARPVVSVEVPGDERAVVVLAGGDQVTVDAVVAAVPPPQLARLLGRPESYGLPPLGGYAPRPIVDVHLWHDHGSVGFDFAALLESPVQWVFQKAPGYLCCSLSAADRSISRPVDELVREAWDEVRAAVPSLGGASLLRGWTTRTPEATYAPPDGVPRPGPATARANLAVAGSWTDTGWPDTMESAIRSGRAAARSLARGAGRVACAMS